MQFNQTNQTVAERTRTENHEGGEAYDPATPELGLTKRVLTNLFEDTYYESDHLELAAVHREFSTCAESNPEFVLQLAAYARQEENLRQVPQALLVLAAEHEATQSFVREYAPDIMHRADEPLDVLALYTSIHSTTLPNCLVKGIEDALHNYSEHQYAKWDRPARDWQYRDLLNIVHPNPRDEKRDRIFEKIAHGELDDYEVEPLRQTNTWESELSKDDDRSKAEKYRASLDSMGLFPRIRQARDMLASGVTADEIFGPVTDEWIKNSRLYPFRFYQAYTALRDEPILNQGVYMRGLLDDTGPVDVPEKERDEALDFLEHAMEVATANIPDSFYDTFVAVDVSGSMDALLSSDSTLQYVEIASLFGALLFREGADVGAFASGFEQISGDRRDSIPRVMQRIQETNVGGGTSGHLVPANLNDTYERIVLFTDMQMWGGSFRDELHNYWDRVGEDVPVYLVDLNNYGDLLTPEPAPNVYNIQGWSENVIDYIDKMDTIDGLISEIESYEP